MLGEIAGTREYGRKDDDFLRSFECGWANELQAGLNASVFRNTLCAYTD